MLELDEPRCKQIRISKFAYLNHPTALDQLTALVILLCRISTMNHLSHAGSAKPGSISLMGQFEFIFLSASVDLQFLDQE